MFLVYSLSFSTPSFQTKQGSGTPQTKGVVPTNKTVCLATSSNPIVPLESGPACRVPSITTATNKQTGAGRLSCSEDRPRLPQFFFFSSFASSFFFIPFPAFVHFSHVRKIVFQRHVRTAAGDRKKAVPKVSHVEQQKIV
mmetsp:Transcript_28680/g.73275  ORF Transcript_28680/g.73275 Transcript_28680/m.73275 type:complete len:140 (+) Transcript_28680:833-1252(+)